MILLKNELLKWQGGAKGAPHLWSALVPATWGSGPDKNVYIFLRLKVSYFWGQIILKPCPRRNNLGQKYNGFYLCKGHLCV